MGRSGRSGGGGGRISGGGRSSSGFSGGGRSGGMRSSGRSSFSSSSRPRSSSSFGSSSMGRSSGGFSSSPRPSTPRPTPTPPQRPMTPPPVRHVTPPPPRPVAPPPIHRPRVVVTPRPVHHTAVYVGGTVERSTYESERAARRTIMWVIIACLMVFGFILLFTRGGNTNITKSTVEREKLEATVSLNTGYYTDEAGWIQDEAELTSGLKYFYEKTGVVPYVYIINEINGNYDPSTDELESFASTKYEELFDDQAHLLLLFWDYDGSWEYTTWLGSQTGVVMDYEARDILFDYIDYYYYEADTDERFFSYAFRDTANRIMDKQTSSFVIVAVIGGAIALVYIGFKWWEKKKESDTKKAEYNKEILNTPLEKLSNDLSVLEEKYKG